MFLIRNIAPCAKIRCMVDRRLAGALVVAVLVLGGLIGAFIVATPADDEDAAAPTRVAGLRVSLFERPGTDVIGVAPLPAGFDPSTLRRAGGNTGTVSWYVARLTGQPDSVCLLSFAQDDAVRRARCGSITRGLVAGVRRHGGRWRIAGVVPDGITSVQVRRTRVPVRDNLFTLTTRHRPPDLVVLRGPTATAIPPSGAAFVAVPADDPTPAVPVSLEPEPPRAGGLPGPGEATLEEAAAAMPFTLLVPGAPPLGGRLMVMRSPDDPRFFPQVTLIYLPEAAGEALSLLEGAHRGRPGPRDGERTVVRDGREIYVSGEGPAPERPQVRLTVEGTDVQISGGLPTEALLDVAASLRPVG